MAQYLYRLEPTRPEMTVTGPTEEEAAVVAAHFDYLAALCTEGVVLLAGRTLDEDGSSFGITVLQAGDDAAARAVMERDPAVVNGVMRATLHPYRVALAHPSIVPGS